MLILILTNIACNSNDFFTFKKTIYCDNENSCAELVCYSGNEITLTSSLHTGNKIEYHDHIWLLDHGDNCALVNKDDCRQFYLMSKDCTLFFN